MGEAAYFRKAASLPLATGRNQGSVRYDSVNKVAKVSNGTTWDPITEFDVTFNALLNDEAVDQTFYIANAPVQVVAVRENHAVAGNDAGAVTLAIKKCTGTQAPSAGTTVLTGTFNMKATANTVQAGTLSATLANTQLAAGNRLAADFTGTVTTLEGVNVTVTLRYI